MSYPDSISQAIGDDHKGIDRYIDELRGAKTLQEQVEWRNALAWRLARHAISEELTMYPAMEKHMGAEGLELTNTDREQHQAVKEDLYKLQSMSPDDREFFPLLDRLATDYHSHVEHESKEDMPRLEKILSREESAALAKSFEQTKMITPTRSHPGAPNRPYFENFAAFLAAPIDKLQDLLRAFPEDSKL